MLVASLAILSLCSCADSNWTAIVYPDRSDLSEHEIVGVFSELDGCRDAALSRLRELGPLSAGDYECGLNCEFREGWGDTLICETTRQ